MNPDFTLATTADADLLLELMQEFYALEHLDFNEQAARQALRQILNDARFGAVYVIGGGGDVAGYVVLTFGFSLEFRGRDALVDELYLREKFRGQGIGKAALIFVEGVCQREGIKALHLEVERGNRRAQGLYHGAGYRDHDRYLLTKWLGEV